TINADISVATLDLIAGTLGGSGTVTVTQQLNWSGGAQGGIGKTVLAADANGSLTATTIKAINNTRILENRGTMSYTGNGVLFGSTGSGSGKIVNAVGAVFDMADGAQMNPLSSGSYAFENEGLLRKSGTGTAMLLNGVPLI